MSAARREARVPAGIPGAIRRALAEDRADRDRTTLALFPRPLRARAVVAVQAPGVVAGVAVAVAIARARGLTVQALARDGQTVSRGEKVLSIEGDLRRILAVERTLLNYLMHLSGVATATARAVRAAGTGRGGPAVLATRKTLPGLRDLEKWAVVLGGGRPHRRDLASGILVKNNHLTATSLEEAIRRLRARGGARADLEVEVRSAAQALRAARAGASTLLLDNRSPRAARRIVVELARAGLRDRVAIELSGGITPANVGAYRRVGADAVSLGAITHSAPALPFHVTVDSLRRKRSRPT
ncbi:MAG: carboxylating nicotinate-nucleotide diphosphorylase [Thermoplasmata archaeon]|nr:carboxylating nicotinate-nucleotide diphosphorylase [Thermoplasmata archaeon]